MSATSNIVVRKNTNEDEAKEFLQEYDVKYGRLLNDFTISSWNYETNITDENEGVMTECALKVNTRFSEGASLFLEFLYYFSRCQTIKPKL